jgi:ABC-2 type transport system ATP-binding protein
LVEGIEATNQPQEVKVFFEGTEAEAADLMRHLIMISIPLRSFYCTQEDLETIFLKLGHQQAS